MQYDLHGYKASLELLVQLCINRKKGYTKAAEFIQQDHIEKLFVKFAKQSEDFAYELLHYLDHSDNDSLAEIATTDEVRGWRNFDEKLDEITRDKLLKVCLKEEKIVIGDYEDVLENQLPDAIEQTINHQLVEITNAFDTVENLNHGNR